jgi:hypothetical protein
MTGRETTVPTWCDGTPHSPQAIPPLPFHDWRWMGDDPYTECARCGQINGHDGRTIKEGRVL